MMMKNRRITRILCLPIHGGLTFEVKKKPKIKKRMIPRKTNENTL
jgi:hypothetical protein